MSINTTSTGGFFGVNGNLNIQSGICASTYSYFDSSFNKVDITNSITSLSSISGAIVDIGSTQTITGAKTFSGGITVSSEVDTGNLTVSGLFSQTKDTNLYYAPNTYGSKITIATASQNLLSSGNTGTIYKWYHINTTYTTTRPTLLLPDPVATLAGVEIYFVRCGAANALSLQTVNYATANTSNFLISSSATNITPSFILGSTWYKVGFVCLINPDATGTQYSWNQILYQ